MNKALKVIIFVIVMGTVSSALLVGVDALTAQRIAKNEDFKRKSSVLDVFDIPYDKSNVISIFDKNVKELLKLTEGEYIYNIADGSIVFKFSGPGLWGPIKGFICLEKDLKTIRKIKITYQEETPGLGGRIAEQEYLKQFKNKEVLPKLVFMPEGKAKQKNEVDAITGATGSSRAFEKLINENIKKYLAILK